MAKTIEIKAPLWGRHSHRHYDPSKTESRKILSSLLKLWFTAGMIVAMPVVSLGQSVEERLASLESALLDTRARLAGAESELAASADRLEVIRKPIHPRWLYDNHLAFVAGEENTGGGTISAVAHAHDNPLTSFEFTGYRSRGTLADPQPLKNGDRIGRYACVIWDGANFRPTGCFDFMAAEDHTTTAYGTYCHWRLVERGTDIQRVMMKLDDRGGLSLLNQAGYLSVGLNPATTGAVRLENRAAISARTTDNRNVMMVYLDASNAVRIGSNITPITLDPPHGGLRINNQQSGSGTEMGTLGNAPLAGNPTYWLPVNINGVRRHIPCW